MVAYPRGLPPADPQPLAQHHRRRRAPQLTGHAARFQLGHHGVLDRCPLPGIGLSCGRKFQQLVPGQRGQVLRRQRLLRRRQVSQRRLHLRWPCAESRIWQGLARHRRRDLRWFVCVLHAGG